MMLANARTATRQFYQRRSLPRSATSWVSDSPSSRTGKPPAYDVVVVGGGIVGCASALQIVDASPSLKVAILEKEDRLAAHQSGHNSGVIHMGIYYKPGSLKARLCAEGATLAYQYFDKNNVPYRKCGKLIVATNTEEVHRLEKLYQNGLENNVKDLSMIGPEEIMKREPQCSNAIKAIHSPHTGIVDFGVVTRSYGEQFEKRGGDVLLNFEVDDFRYRNESGEGDAPGDIVDYPVSLVSKDGRSVSARYVLTCGGLHSDRLSILSGCSPEPKIVAFRGEYLLLGEEKRSLIHGNIYPVPNPKFPFLGVHLTPRMDGSMWVGPNAVLALSREGYRWRDVNLGDLWDSLTYRGLQRLMVRNVVPGLSEILRSVSISAQCRNVRRLVPAIEARDLSPGPTGVRALAIDRQGSMVDDFLLRTEGRVLHVLNAPSPAATSSLSIARMVAEKALRTFSNVDGY